MIEVKLSDFENQLFEVPHNNELYVFDLFEPFTGDCVNVGISKYINRDLVTVSTYKALNVGVFLIDNNLFNFMIIPTNQKNTKNPVSVSDLVANYTLVILEDKELSLAS